MGKVRGKMLALCGVLLVLGVLAALLATRGARAVPPLPVASCAESKPRSGLVVRWFGTSTLTISDGESTVMIDGFFSRPGMVRLGLSSLGMPLVRPDPEQLQLASRLLCGQPVDAIFVAHAHHDHALDAAIIGREKDAVIHGSESVLNVVRGQDPQGHAKLVEVGDGSIVPIGKFQVSVLSSSHKDTFFGPDGAITRPLPTPARLRAFRSGPSFAFFVGHPQGNVLIVPSAVMDDQGPALKGLQADVVLLGIGMLGREPDTTKRRYWLSVVRATGATNVHLIHWDDFTRTLDKPLRPFPLDRVDRTVAYLSSIDRNVRVTYLPFAKPVAIVRRPHPLLPVDTGASARANP